MRYWWVNHKKTFKFEIAGGFLWSPMRNKNNARNQFYDNMRLASPGDAVISYSHGEICNIGLVASLASPQPKPSAFGTAGDYWSEQGWCLPVKWQTLAKPVIPKEKIESLRKVLPLKYSPIHPATGHGRQNAYLAEVDKFVFDILVGELAFQACSAESLATYAMELTERTEQSFERQIFGDKRLDETVKSTLIAARRGQGVFRERIYDFEDRCRLTKVSNPVLLIASHMKPWCLCSSAEERLDGANGLLLTPNVDRLFDRGLVSFNDDGTLLISTRLDLEDFRLLGLHNDVEKSSGSFQVRQIRYLSFHREKVFLS